MFSAKEVKMQHALYGLDREDLSPILINIFQMRKRLGSRVCSGKTEQTMSHGELLKKWEYLTWRRTNPEGTTPSFRQKGGEIHE